MTLTQQQQTEFLAALGVWNGAALDATIEAQADAGDDIADRADFVATHETLADFTASRGRPQESQPVAYGKTLRAVSQGSTPRVAIPARIRRRRRQHDPIAEDAPMTRQTRTANIGPLPASQNTGWGFWVAGNCDRAS
jgi:hypothetical protein